MSIFSNLFRNRSKTENPVTILSTPEHSSGITQPENIPPIDLFIDNQVPNSDQQVSPERQSKITVFLNQNCHSRGISEGFEYHSQEILEIGKKKIAAEFQFIIDQEIEAMSQRKLELKSLVIDVAKISDDTRQKLELGIDDITISLSKLEKQKELAAENKGWVMNVIYSYHQGFLQGLNDFISETNFIKASNYFTYKN